MIKYLLSCSLLICTFSLALAQPHAGKCHHAAHALKLEPLTEFEEVQLQLSNERSDSIDIQHYDIHLTVIDFTNEYIEGNTTLSIESKMDGIDHIMLDLLALGVDSVVSNGNLLNFSYDDEQISIQLPVMMTGDRMDLTVHYGGNPVVDPTGFGGFAFSDGYAYNLGIGLGSNPYNYGRGWYPCFDNFIERATYDLHVKTADGREAWCIGNLVNETELGGDTLIRSFEMDKELPTYLVGVAVSKYIPMRSTHQGVDRELPTLLLAQAKDTTRMKNSFRDLGTAIDQLEAVYGPYVWDQVGYVLTTRGAMEHASLIAYPEFTGTSGPNDDQNRLMAHELAHHWWGNIVNHSTASDMWIKEGNAEYGAHLFVELDEGKDAFLRTVTSNHLRMMKFAHQDDDGYWPLSGIPYEHTYGTHTYNKGASMIHNMRGYMGDSLFQLGQRGVLTKHAFSGIDAAQYRDALTETTGMDMTSFFDAWIYRPGWVAHQIDSMVVAPSGNEYRATVHMKQSLYNAPEYHTNVPLKFTFFGADLQEYTTTAMIGGATSQAEVMVPFEPVAVAPNKDYAINLAQISEQRKVFGSGSARFAYTDFSIDVKSDVDSAVITLDHFWVAPDNYLDAGVDVRLSSTHYWKVGGVWPEGMKATAMLFYDGVTPPKFDEDLVGETEDSIKLVYRPGVGDTWQLYPFYRVRNTIQGDSKGIVMIDSLLPGEYTFANGELDIFTSTNSPLLADLNLFPNPTTSAFTLRGSWADAQELEVEIVDVLGRKMMRHQWQHPGGNFDERIQTATLEDGIYFINLTTEQGELLHSDQLVIER